MPQSESERESRVNWVSEDIIRQLFDDGQYRQRADSGELTEKLKRESHRLPPPGGEPPCTKSQIVLYINVENKVVAIAHRYLRPDGTLGASRQPDPKYLVHEGKVYKLRQTRADES